MATIKTVGDKVFVSGMEPSGRQFRKTYSKQRHGPGFKTIARQKYEELLFENSGLINAGSGRRARNMRVMTVKELAEKYNEEHLSETKAAGNKSYIHAIISRWGGWRLDQITIGVVRPWIRSYLNGTIKKPNDKKFHASYAKKLTRYFQRLYNWGCESDIIDRNPLDHLIDHSLKKEFSRRIKPRRTIITLEDFEKIIDVSPLWFQRIARHAWGTGMREGEIARLKWASIQDDIIFLEPDENKEADCKTIVMEPQVVDQVNTIRLEQGFEGRNDFVYLGESGNLLLPSQISDSWRTYRRKAGLESRGIRFHDIRRTFIDRKRRGGASRWTLASQVGHHAVETTEWNYPTTATMEEIRGLAKISNNEKK